MYFLIVLEVGESKIKLLEGLVLGEGLLPALETAAFLLCAHVVFLWYMLVDRSLSFYFLILGTNHIMRLPPS